MELEEIKQILIDRDFVGGTIFENPSYCTAFLGVTDKGQLVYSYEKMIEFLVKEDNMTEEEAIEFIDYNTLRTIPYMGSLHPIIVYDLK